MRIAWSDTRGPKVADVVRLLLRAKADSNVQDKVFLCRLLFLQTLISVFFLVSSGWQHGALSRRDQGPRRGDPSACDGGRRAAWAAEHGDGLILVVFIEWPTAFLGSGGEASGGAGGGRVEGAGGAGAGGA